MSPTTSTQVASHEASPPTEQGDGLDHRRSSLYCCLSRLSSPRPSASPTSGGGGSFAFARTISRERLSSLRLGTPRSKIEKAVGKGKTALDQDVDTGIAVEPTDATCTYYPQSLTNIRNIIQLCYRDDRLVSKHAYEGPPGAPLTADSQP